MWIWTNKSKGQNDLASSDNIILWDHQVRHAQSFSSVQFFETPWTIAHQDPLSMGFPRQEYWSELPRPSPGRFDLPEPGIEPVSPVSLALAGRFFTSWATWKPENTNIYHKQVQDLEISEDLVVWKGWDPELWEGILILLDVNHLSSLGLSAGE